MSKRDRNSTFIDPEDSSAFDDENGEEESFDKNRKKSEIADDKKRDKKKNKSTDDYDSDDESDNSEKEVRLEVNNEENLNNAAETVANEALKNTAVANNEPEAYDSADGDNKMRELYEKRTEMNKKLLLEKLRENLKIREKNLSEIKNDLTKIGESFIEKDGKVGKCKSKIDYIDQILKNDNNSQILHKIDESDGDFKKFTGLKNEIDKLKGQIEAKNNEIKEYNSKLSNEKEDLKVPKELKKSAESNKQLSEDVTNRIKGLSEGKEASINQLKDDLKSKKGELEKLNNQLKKNIETLKDEKKKLEKEKKKLEKERKDFKKQGEKLQEQISGETGDIKRIEGIIDCLESGKPIEYHELRYWNKDIEAQNQGSDDYEKEISEFRKGCTTIEWKKPKLLKRVFRKEIPYKVKVGLTTVELKSSNHKKNGREYRIINFETTIKNARGAINFSFVAQDKNGKKVTEREVQKFGLSLGVNYGPDGKIASMNPPTGYYFEDDNKDSPMMVKRGSDTYILPITRKKWEELNKEIAQGRGEGLDKANSVGKQTEQQSKQDKEINPVGDKFIFGDNKERIENYSASHPEQIVKVEPPLNTPSSGISKDRRNTI